jgi:hypothetical protein
MKPVGVGEIICNHEVCKIVTDASWEAWEIEICIEYFVGDTIEDN